MGGSGGVTRMVDQAPVAEAWRILLPDHVIGVSIQADTVARRIDLIRRWFNKR